MSAPGPFRVAYCTNVAPAASVADLTLSLRTLWPDVRRRTGDDLGLGHLGLGHLGLGHLGPEPLGLGLWFEEAVATELAGSSELRAEVRAALVAGGLELVTVNAFPQRAFHAPVVKEAVYRPDWREPARTAYTLDVARAAAGIAGPGTDVTLSTLPVGFPKLGPADLGRAAERLVIAALKLDDLSQETGTELRLALEPEPACALETTAETVAFFRDYILPRCGNREATVRQRLGVCLDLCHVAVAHEDPVAALETYEAVGIGVFKVQVSSALEVPDPASSRDLLRAFVEPRWLHQVGLAPGRVALDLADVLDDPAHEGSRGPWRVHFHVPLSASQVGGLPTTQPEVERFLDHVKTLERPPVLELETYTWSVVPGAGDDLAEAVAAEVSWVRSRLATP